MVFEVADRAVNEVLAGHARCVDITLTPDGGVCVPMMGGAFASTKQAAAASLASKPC
ncbi:hypothetical protein [Kitasatospora sp. NPDC050543]|uniref:hypothetical protein n=1 Tax=Kitasatospora sp. NPDC050543 TaxID=3364054 RepID=UPI0037BBAE89